MKKLTIQLNQQYRSFENGFNTTLEGDLTILSGVNGAGKSQIINIILGHDKPYSAGISSIIKIDGIEIKKEDIDFRSFKENINIAEITLSNAQAFSSSVETIWSFYQQSRLNIDTNNGFLDSCLEAKNILLQHFSEEQFNQGIINEKEFKEKLQNSNFVIRAGDKFTNNIGEIFFSHALKINEAMKEVGRKNFDPEKLPKAPWKRLNNLFAKLNLDYRFRDHYEVTGVDINEQPQLYALKNDGMLDESNSRRLSDLSDGEKTIISLCFASLSNSPSAVKKLLLLDELDAVLNPSLIQIFFTVIQEFFIDQGVMVIMATHSPATISLSPDNATYYEIFRPNQKEVRILEVSRDEYSELQIANKDFYDKITDQDKRIDSLLQQINSPQEILIITEGKTDWKYMLGALKYFNSNQEFLDIKEEFFYRFGSDKDKEQKICGCNKIDDLSDSKLRSYLNSLMESRKIDANHNQIRIGIFDSDNKEIRIVNDKENKVFSFKIEPIDISTEFLFDDSEIKTDFHGKRLYIGDEFDQRTKKHSCDLSLSLGGSSSNTNKAGKRTIIESDVYNSSNENIALSKEKFAQAVFNGEVEISKKSWENFRHIFEKIKTFLDQNHPNQQSAHPECESTPPPSPHE
jgi:ABC-type multidrug transport system ATPase subunit